MKDYALVRYLAKLTGAKLKIGKDELCCFFPYSDNGDAFVPTHIIFEHRQSVVEFFDLTEVYDEYGDKYDSYKAFVDEFVAQNDFFDTMEYNGVLCVKSDLTVNKMEHTASPALINYSVVIIALNKMLGRKEIVIQEDEWRRYHREMLKKLTDKNRFISYLSLAAGIAGIVLACIAGNSAVLTALAIILLLGGIVATPIFFIRGRYYKSLYKKALREKNY